MNRTLRIKGDRIISFNRMEMMGIVNVTPDSFYAGSRMMEEMPGEDDHAAARALEKAARHIEEGAMMIDVGGESTRPGAAPVSADEEIRRICPVIRQIRAEHPGIVISADTYRGETARAALEAGADMINDISGLSFDPSMADVVAGAGAAIVLMHTGGRPQTMQKAPRYEDVVEEVYGFLGRQISFALERGIGRDQIMIDMGIGFGKTLEHNLELLRHVDRFHELDCPHLLAVSRKSMIGSILDRSDPEDRLPGTLAITAYGAVHGMAAARVHDVKQNLDAARMMETLTRKMTATLTRK